MGDGGGGGPQESLRCGLGFSLGNRCARGLGRHLWASGFATRCARGLVLHPRDSLRSWPQASPWGLAVLVVLDVAVGPRPSHIALVLSLVAEQSAELCVNMYSVKKRLILTYSILSPTTFSPLLPFSLPPAASFFPIATPPALFFSPPIPLLLMLSLL
jgi:hypothetical protein